MIDMKDEGPQSPSHFLWLVYDPDHGFDCLPLFSKIGTRGACGVDLALALERREVPVK